MSVSTRKDAARNREAVLDAARDLMGTSSTFTMSQVARRAGVGQATLYRNFPDRAALATALAAELHEEIAATVAAHPASFAALLDTIVDCAVRSHGLTQVVREREDAWRELERLRDELIVLVDGPLRAAQAAGEIGEDVRPEDVFLLLAMIDGALQGVVEPARRRALAERTRRLVLSGMARG
jgi:AcrR family transcriptional regulator